MARIAGDRVVAGCNCWRNRALVLKETPQPQILAGIASLARDFALNI